MDAFLGLFAGLDIHAFQSHLTSGRHRMYEGQTARRASDRAPSNFGGSNRPCIEGKCILRADWGVSRSALSVPKADGSSSRQRDLEEKQYSVSCGRESGRFAAVSPSPKTENGRRNVCMGVQRAGNGGDLSSRRKGGMTEREKI